MFEEGPSQPSSRRSRTQAEREHIGLLLKVARLYWIDGMQQSEIAQQVGYSRPSVSRLLQQARDRQMVHIRVEHPLERVQEMEAELAQRHGLRVVRVAEHVPGLTPGTAVARCAADLLCEHLSSDGVLSISNGRAVAATVEAMPQLHYPHSRVVQMIGSVGSSNVLLDSPETCRSMAGKLGGRYHALPVPLVVQSRAVSTALRTEEQISTTLELATRADVALVGVGAVINGHSGEILAHYEDRATELALRRARAVGHICAHHFQADGHHVPTPVCGRTMAVDLDRIGHIPMVIGVAWGEDKVAPVSGALAGGYLSALATDRATATALLSLGEHR